MRFLWSFLIRSTFVCMEHRVISIITIIIIIIIIYSYTFSLVVRHDPSHQQVIATAVITIIIITNVVCTISSFDRAQKSLQQILKEILFDWTYTWINVESIFHTFKVQSVSNHIFTDIFLWIPLTIHLYISRQCTFQCQNGFHIQNIIF